MPLLLLLLLGQTEAMASEIDVSLNQSRLTPTYSLTDLQDDRLDTRIASGLTVHLNTHAALIDVEKEVVIEQRLIDVSVRFDLWEERYHLRTRTPDQSLDEVLPTAEALRNRLLHRPQRPTFDTASLRPGHRYQIRIVVAVDPLTEAQQAEVLQWLSRPQEGHRRLGLGGRSFLGSLLSFFVRRRQQPASKMLSLVSSPFDLKSLHAASP